MTITNQCGTCFDYFYANQLSNTCHACKREQDKPNPVVDELTRQRDDATNLLREVARITCAEHWYDDELEEGSEDCSVCQLLERVRKFGIKE